MHAHGARHLRQARNRFFHVAPFEHHEVCQLIDQDQDLRQRLDLFRLGIFIFKEAARLRL